MDYVLSMPGRFSKCDKYFDVCRESSNQFEEHKKQFENARKTVKAKKGWDFLLGYSSLMDESFTNAVIYGVMTLEAFMYDYATTKFSAGYYDKYLDNLRLLQKWLFIPKLAVGKMFAVEGQAYQALVELIERRNELVHYKSLKVPDKDTLTNAQIKKLVKHSKKKQAGYRLNPYEAVVIVLQGLKKLDHEDWWGLVKL